MWRLSRECGLICVGSVLLTIAILFGIQRPFSSLFNNFNTEIDLLNKAQRFNKIRYKKAMNYFNSFHELSADELKSELSQQQLDIVVSIVTVARAESSIAEPRGYLIQTAAMVDASLKVYRTNLRKLLVVCNANDNPEWNKDAVLLQKYIPYINTKSSNVINGGLSYKAAMKNSKLTDVKRKREIEDYVFCLNATRKLNSKYLLMLEDDVIPLQDAFSVIEHTLKYRLRQRSSGRVLGDFAFIKLYYPQRWQGFANEADRLAELVSIGLVGGIVLAVTFSLLCNTRTGLKSITATQFFFWTLISISMAWVIGRVGIMELRRVSPWFYKFVRSPACCTQAMLFPAEVVPRLMDHLLVNTSMNKDLAIHDFSVKTGIPGYQLEPNLFLHTGMHTSLSVNADRKKPVEFLFDMPFDLHSAV